MVSSVVKVFDERMKSVSSGCEIVGRVSESCAVDVGDETELHRRIGEIAQRVVGHLRAKIRTTNADVDDILDRLASVAFPFAAPNAVGESCHLVEHGVNVGHDVFSVNFDFGAS
jgi:hypothetical protein